LSGTGSSARLAWLRARRDNAKATARQRGRRSSRVGKREGAPSSAMPAPVSARVSGRRPEAKGRPPKALAQERIPRGRAERQLRFGTGRLSSARTVPTWRSHRPAEPPGTPFDRARTAIGAPDALRPFYSEQCGVVNGSREIPLAEQGGWEGWIPERRAADSDSPQVFVPCGSCLELVYSGRG
jgi:hypothetical protein